MSKKVRNGARPAVATTLASIFTATGLFAQAPECQPEGNTAAATASEELQALAEAATAADSTAIFAEAWEAIAVDLDSDNWVVPVLAAQIQIGLGDFGEAEEILDRFDEIAPPECVEHGANQRYNAWVQLYNSGAAALNAADYETAIQAFMHANDFRPDFITYNIAARLQAQAGNLEGAIEIFQTALAAEIPDADPDGLREAVGGLGDFLMAADRGEEALTTYSSYLVDYPDDVVIQIRYAGALEAQGRQEESTAIYEEIGQRDDLTPEQLIQVGVGLFNSGRYGEAATAFSDSRASNPYNKTAMENYVTASIESGSPGPVIALADTLTQWYPYDARAHQLHSRALALADMGVEAEAVMAEAAANPLSFSSSDMGGGENGVYEVQVFLVTPASETVQITFEFLDITGAVVMTETHSLNTGAENLTFQVQSGVPLAGFRYGTTGG